MSASSTEAGPPSGVRSRSAVTYRVVPGYRPLLLDVHRPDTEDLVPLVLFLHGGAWRFGDRTKVGPGFAGWDPSPFTRLVQAGFAVASADYRFSAEDTFPAQLEDATAALAWLHEQAGELGLDPDRTAVWGESAGGHLAALLGLTSPDVTAVVDWYGPADLLTFAADADATGICVTDPHAQDSAEAALLGAIAQEVPELARSASPVHRVGPGAPPFLLIHGTADRFVAQRQSERLAEALQAAGAKPELHLLEGADHAWMNDPEYARAAFDLTLEFLRSTLR